MKNPASFPKLPNLLTSAGQVALAYGTLLMLPGYSLFEKPAECLDWTNMVLFSSRVLLLISGWLYVEKASKSKKKATTTSTKKKALSVLSVFLITLAGIFLFHTLAVLFGAPLTEMVEHTWSGSTYISLLLVFPASAVFHTDRNAWNRVFLQTGPENYGERFAYYPMISGVFGAWLGAIVIPLDWDRPWQAWPIPCVLGALLGYTVGICLALIKQDSSPKKLGKLRTE
ncbi:PIG-F-domain-containing protein [Basidiobolus meristosporus CBS 931.73]|uniref:PIG-F-domain-containing protein n=1 Tax=Basidiobolus meristosporus CBS 931.73 TaxID=1314790 RepID=A0A1Y1Z4R4_9FUNG|nr:PIG-F-domain-containing protein [Basidiobolus meristosporus CBS 931.73]|eukprot:ORY05253.1 PIG-F-domain-containing protein [Basidiobolus meristosporus CBS 931.73]